MNRNQDASTVVAGRAYLFRHLPRPTITVEAFSFTRR